MIHLLLILMAAWVAHSCTLTHVDVKNSLIVGRTMELGDEVPWSVWAAPRRATTPAERFDAVIVGFRAFGLELSVDGMNTAGLTVSAHSFTTSEYQQVAPGPSEKPAIMYADLTRFLLMRFSTCAEVIDVLSNKVKVVAPRILDNQGHLFLHWGVQDATGQSLVVEYERGELKLHNNTATGVMTNDPGFEWHRYNARQFAGLSGEFRPANPAISPSYPSHGWNLIGIPGDLGPPARFARTFVLKQLSLQSFPPRTLEEGFTLVEKLISAVVIPRGSVGPNSRTEKVFDYTQWITVKQPKERLLYYKTYSQSAWRVIDLKRVRFDGKRLMRLDSKAPPGGYSMFADEHLDATEALNQAALDTRKGLQSVGLGNGVLAKAPLHEFKSDDVFVSMD